MLIPARIRNCIDFDVWGESTYPIQNLNDGTDEVYEWIDSFIPNFTGDVIHTGDTDDVGCSRRHQS